MKLWLSGLALLMVATATPAENIRIVQSPAQKLDIWIDDIKDNSPRSWCRSEVTLRIVANGNKNVTVLEDFMPRLGALLEKQCSKLNKLNWQLNDPADVTLAQGHAKKSQAWRLVVNQPPASDTPEITPDQSDSGQITDPQPVLPLTGSEQPGTSPTIPVNNSGAVNNPPIVDRTPWLEFTLPNGCRLRTFQQEEASALFIPDSNTLYCGEDKWLSGHAMITQSYNGVYNEMVAIYIQGFPVLGLSQNAEPQNVLLTSVNKERMVFRLPNSDNSWMILPYNSALDGWKANNTVTVAVVVTDEVASNSVKLQAHLDAIKRIWNRWVAPGTTLNTLLFDRLPAQWSEPAFNEQRVNN